MIKCSNSIQESDEKAQMTQNPAPGRKHCGISFQIFVFEYMNTGQAGKRPKPQLHTIPFKGRGFPTEGRKPGGLAESYLQMSQFEDAERWGDSVVPGSGQLYVCVLGGGMGRMQEAKKDRFFLNQNIF